MNEKAAGSMSRYLEDASGYCGEADRVFFPESTAEIREIVKNSRREHISLTVAGAGTGLTGARVPHGGWLVSLEKFRHCVVATGRAVCGAGVLLSELSHAAAQTRQFLGPNPTETSASAGGIVSTNAGGARSFRYGSARKQVLALEATLMSGETRRFERGEAVDFTYQVVDPPNTTKNAAGYYLRPNLEWVDLLAGSEGTLAIISSVELELKAEPGAVLSGVIFFREDGDAVQAVEAWRAVPELRLLEYLDEPALDLLRPHYSQIPTDSRAALMVEQNLRSEQDAEVDAWADRVPAAKGDAEGSWFGFSAADQERFRAFRHLLPTMVVDRVRRNGFPKFGTDFAVPLAKAIEVHQYFRQECTENMPGRHTIFGHAGDANNHINLLPQSNADGKASERLIENCAREVIACGGTIAAEHGIGKTKTRLLGMMYSAEQIEAMRQVKRYLDPEWLLGRGTIFPVEQS